jgi:hypothetical protein
VSALEACRQRMLARKAAAAGCTVDELLARGRRDAEIAYAGRKPRTADEIHLYMRIAAYSVGNAYHVHRGGE